MILTYLTHIVKYESRLIVVSDEAKKKQHACTFSGLRNYYYELFTSMVALKFVNTVTKLP